MTEAAMGFVVFARLDPSGVMQHAEHTSFAAAVAWAMDVHQSGDARVGIHRGDVSMAARLALAARVGMTLTDDDTCPDEDAELWANHGIVRMSLGLHVLPQVTGVVRLLAIAPLGVPFAARPASLVAPRCNLVPTGEVFLGRTEALANLEHAWLSGAWVVTVVGPPGIGKSATARRFAQTLWDEPSRRRPADAVWYVELSQASEATTEALIAAVANALEVVGGELAVDDIGRVIAAEGRCLLVLDNADRFAEQLAGVLPQWRRLAGSATFLVTSREHLALSGEVLVELGPLPGEDALTLFYSRGALGGRYEVNTTVRQAIGRVVEQLHGNPLAIGLTARRSSSRVLGPADLAERLQRSGVLSVATRGRRDASEHHASLRAAIAWSWDELDADERRALTTLSVFPSGLTLSRAEDVLQAASLELDTLDVLVAKSLVVIESERQADVGVLPRQRRFHVYPLVAEFVRAQQSLAEESIQAMLATHVAALRIEDPTVGELAAEWGSLVAARDGGCKAAESLLLKAAESVPQHERGRAGVRLTTGESATPDAPMRLRRRLERAIAQGALLTQAQVLLALAGSVDELEEAEQALARALAIARILGARELMLRGLWECALIECGRSRFERAAEILAEVSDGLPAPLEHRARLLSVAVQLRLNRLDLAQLEAQRLPVVAPDDPDDAALVALVETGLELVAAIDGQAPAETHHQLALQLSTSGRELRDQAQRPSTALVAHLLLSFFADHIALAQATADHALPSVAFLADGTWLKLPGGETVDFTGSPLLARLTAHLLQERVDAPGRPVPSATMLEVGWGDEPVRRSTSVLRNRLYVAIRELRSKGLEGYLVSDRRGYWLSTEVVWLRRNVR